MSRTLRRKLWRDLRVLRGQAVAVALIVACAAASYVCVRVAYTGLTSARDSYVATYRMPHLFAPVDRAPLRVARDVERIPGVRRARGRITFEVKLLVEGMEEPAVGRVQSLPDRREPVVGDVRLVRGRWFGGDGTREVILATSFAREHRLDVGDSIDAVMNDRLVSLRVVGIAQSPEFIYMIRGAGELLPDPRRFTALWLSRSFSESVFDYADACNEVVALLERDARPDDVLREVDRRLDEHGAMGAYLMKDQLSYNVITEEITGLAGTAAIVPGVFLVVAAFVLNVALARLAHTQRTQIAVFRAFGYSVRQMVGHYARLALVIGGAGALIGVAAGLWLGHGMLGIYERFYQFPDLAFRVDPVTLAVAVLATVGFAVGGGASAARAVASLHPAEGMRPEAPALYSPTALERSRRIWTRLPYAWRMIVRRIARTPGRTATTLCGMLLATSILVLTFFGHDAVDALMEVQFDRIELQDVRVTFHRERGRDAIHALGRIPGVVLAEPETWAPVRLRSGHRHRRVALTGLTSEHLMHGLLDTAGRPIDLPRDGVLLSRKLAEILHVSRGEEIDVEVLDGRRRHFPVRVSGIVDEYLGLGAYTRIERLSRWVGEEYLVTGALLRVDPARRAEVSRTLEDLPAVNAAVYRERTIEAFESTIAESQSIMNGTMLIFAGAIAIGVLYNAARIALAEQGRTLATMRVLGFSRAETGRVLSGESALLTTAALPAGVLLGAALSYALSRTYDTDVYRFPFVLKPLAVVSAVAAVVVFAALSSWLVRRKARRMDILEILGERE